MTQDSLWQASLLPQSVQESFPAETTSQGDWKMMFRRHDKIIGRNSPNCLFRIVDGLVKLSATNAVGKELIVDVAGPGDFLGPIEVALLGENGIDCNEEVGEAEAIALTSGIIHRLQVEPRHNSTAAGPSLSKIELSRHLAIKSNRLQNRIGRLLYRSSMGKLCGLLTELGERFGRQTSDGITIGFRLTHQELASMIGVKRATVSECIGMLEEQEFVELRRGQMVLRKAGELRRLN